MRTSYFITFVILLAVIVSAGCDDDSTTNSKQETAGLPLLSDSLVLAQSDWISASFIEDARLVFDLSGDSLLSVKEANDLLVCYCMPVSCDMSHWLLNVHSDTWENFSYFPRNRACRQLGQSYEHLLSDAGLQLSDFIDSPGRMRLRSEFKFFEIDSIGTVPGYTVLPLKMHPGFRPFSLHWLGDHFVGMAPDGPSYWSFDPFSGELLKVTTDRNIADWLTLRARAVDFAVGQSGIWYAASDGRVFYEDFYAYTPCGADVDAADSLVGLALTDTSMWILGWTAGPEMRALEVLLSDICDDSADVINSLDMPVTALDLSATNNQYYVLLAADSLLRLDSSGEEISREAIPLTRCSRIEVVADTIHILATGPKPFQCNDRMVAKFRLR